MSRLSADELAQMAQEVADHGHAWVHLWDSTKIAALLDEVLAFRAALSLPVAPSPPSAEGAAWAAPFCACGRRMDECDGSRKGCGGTGGAREGTP